jgi:glycine/D-amino acid oxidase-like deaminating enzyme
VTETADVVIVGAGIIGASVAFHLLERDPRLRVVMLEKDPEPGTGATSKAAGGVRFQFSTEANVRLTQLSYRYFTHDREILGRLPLRDHVVGHPRAVPPQRGPAARARRGERGLDAGPGPGPPGPRHPRSGPGAGLHVILLDGRAGSMDIDALSLDRFAAGKLRAEANMF